METGEPGLPALSRREQELLNRFLAEGRVLFPGGEKTAVRQFKDERDATRKASLVHAASISPERCDWLWRDRIPLGELTLIAGRGNVGKSTVLAEQVAWITTGRMKGIYYGTPKPVIYVVNEDSISKTVVPRMLAAGADMRLVFFLEMQTPQGQDALELPRDAERIRDAIDETGAVAVFIDPLSANISGKKNDQTEMRRNFQSVRQIAEDMNCALVGLAHLRKGQTMDIVTAIMGSAEQGHVSRAIHGVVADPEVEGAYIFSLEKSNLGPTTLPAFRYKLESAWVGQMNDVRTSRLRWLEETEITASEVMNDMASGHGSTSEAVEWLRGYLESQGKSSKQDVISAARKDGISQATVYRAKNKLHVVSVRASHRGGRATWELPPITSS